jgi:MFS family permease
MSVGVAALPLYTAGIFMVGLEESYGWSRTVISAGSFLFTIGVATSSPVVGALAERFGLRYVVSASFVVLSTGFFAISRSDGNEIWFLGGMLITGFTGSGTSAVLLTRSIIPYFDRNRGLAFAVVLSGAGLSAIWGPLLFEKIISSAGVVAGYQVLAAGALFAVPFALFLGSPKDSMFAFGTRLPFRFAAITASMTDKKTLILSIVAFVLAMATVGPVVHLVPLLTDQGVVTAKAAAVASTLGVAVIGARLFMGLLLDRFSPPWISFGAASAAGIGIFLIGVGDVTSASFGALLLGFALGAEVDIFAYFVSRYFPAMVYGPTFGLVYGVAITASGISPVLFSVIYKRFGGYEYSIFFCVICAAFAALLFAYGSRLFVDDPNSPARTSPT